MAISVHEPTGQSKIVQRAIQGDSEAFSALFEQYFNAIYHYLVSLSGDSDIADDLAQETFIRAHRNMHRLGPPYAIRPWLYRIAHNTFINHIKGKKISISLDTDIPLASNEPSPEHQVLSSEWAGPVGSALNRLAPTYREALILREIDGFQYNDIAEIMGVSLDSVKVVLHRARASFKDHYSLRVLAEDPLPDCDVLGDLLDSFVDGAIPAADQDRLLRSHLKTCDTCQQRKRQIAAIALLLRGLQVPNPSAELKSGILRKVKRSPIKLSMVLNMIILGLFLGVFGAAALNVAQAAFQPKNQPDDEDETSPPSGASIQDVDETATPTLTLTPGGFSAAPPVTTVTSNVTTEIFAVGNCTSIGGDQFQWYEVEVSYQDGVPINVENLSGPYQGVWQPNCPAANPPTQSGGGTGGGDPCANSCGNGVCEPACRENRATCRVDCRR